MHLCKPLGIALLLSGVEDFDPVSDLGQERKLAGCEGIRFVVRSCEEIDGRFFKVMGCGTDGMIVNFVASS